jgi:hypothetical protein
MALRHLTLPVLAALALALSACGGDEDGDGSIRLSAKDVASCLEEAGLTVERQNGGSRFDLFADLGDGQRANLWIERSPDAAEATGDRLKELSESLGVEDVDQYVVLENNAGAGFTEEPTDEQRETVARCLEG